MGIPKSLGDGIMLKYCIKRILMMIPVLLGVILIVFAIMSLTPGDPARLILGPEAEQEAVDLLRQELRLDEPMLVQFFYYISGIVLRFDFGNSYRTGLPVFNEILVRYPYTLMLAFLSVIMASLIGIPIGILSAVKQYSIADIIPRVVAMFLAAVPLFWLGMMFILLFALTLDWLPSSGIGTWQHYILPVMATSLPSAAVLLRMSRATMLETIRQDYIRTARAKGASELRVIFKHALKNALLPVINSLGATLGILLGGSIVSETVFAVPGLGIMMISAIRVQDIPMVMAATVFLSIIFCMVILITDLAFGFIDPRVRARIARS